MKRERQELKVSEIKTWIYQRSQVDHSNSHGATVSEIAETIKEHGILEPIIFARKVTKNGEVFKENCGIAGFLRFLASKEAKITTIPATVYDELTFMDAVDIMLIENIHRQEMADVDVANMLGFYLASGLQQKDIATRIKRSDAYVSLYLALLHDSEPVREALSERSEGFTEKHARLVRVLPETLHEKAVEKVKGKTVRDARKEVTKMAKANKKAMIRQQLEEEQEKLKTIEKAEKDKLKLDDDLAKLNGQLESLKTDDKNINAEIHKIEVLRMRYFPAQKRLSEATSREKEITKLMPKYEIKPLQKQRDKAYKTVGQLDTQIKALRDQISELRTKREEAKKEAKKLTEQISMVTQLKNERSKLQKDIKDLKSTVAEFERKYKKAIEGFDALKDRVNEHQAKIVEKRKDILTKLGELKAIRNSLNGKIANRKLVEKRIAELEAELK